MRKRAALAALALAFATPARLAAVQSAPPPASAAASHPASSGDLRGEVCRMIERAAAAHHLPPSFLTRLIWRESSFRAHVVSPAGAQGIAQFMPGTAAERGLSDPFDPEQAIPKAAELLADLRARFGNLGLAAAAYNGGPQRVANWLAGSGGLPFETQNYVELVTRHPAEDWRDGPSSVKLEAGFARPATCLATAELIRIQEPQQFAGSTLTAPWGVQLSGSFNKRAALAAYARAQRRFAALLGNGEPMVIGRRAPGRGFARFWRVRSPAQTRAQAERLCAAIERAGGACAVLKT
ncbi:lytic transglycosylase domain-containing protein [Rhodoblastus acidophilus]|uniref:Lytic transglycosylase domain-containing protein n=1 Tax=Candidatus Rhodoblastus alkanivorans TaxID=2954117 RepID=A0ABS9ZAZ1_9HYPH|nr:lytic transglycosylase domain-containing protein [Candidatus Rhodoblastus alkanivorans]MCI4679342.1 lytic transglycosylase domain-containing protein [Candidatus Rhodoblastus alkanivorans]MCI4684818.1 lytic transglycosylase domain-containing protein [Candidatus Rhodoblastus alkanivorans]MDI4642142.1 lytic transglycosylase domain-containing protein [Rhodoblastus acidophilus]